MPLLRPFLTPTSGVPQPVVAQRRQRRNRSMISPDFYNPTSNAITKEPKRPNPEEEFQQVPATEGYLVEQLQRFATRAAPPSLEPAARVRSPSEELVQPSSFQQFYNQLASINQSGQEMLAAEQARSAFARNQALLNAARSIPVGSASTGNSGQNFGSGIPSNPATNFRYAQEIAPKYGWNANELSAWYKLGMNESGWRNTAQNPTSTAYGIGQFLNSTWSTVGGSRTSDPRLQTEYMARYIKQRYGTPSRALAAWNSRSPHWY